MRAHVWAWLGSVWPNLGCAWPNLATLGLGWFGWSPAKVAAGRAPGSALLVVGLAYRQLDWLKKGLVEGENEEKKGREKKIEKRKRKKKVEREKREGRENI